LLGVAFCAALAAGFGVLYHVPAIGPSLGGILLFVPLLLGLVMAMLLAGMIAGWPLLHAAVAAGAENALDALSRSFSYLTQRLGALTFLLLPLALEGLVGLVFVELLAAGVIRLTAWSLSLTAPNALLRPLLLGEGSDARSFAMAAHAFWIGAVHLLAHAWIYSFFWSTAALLYLWLRQDVDATPWTEIDRPAPAAVAVTGPVATASTDAPTESGPSSNI
jgi:hypothetical protein